MVQVCPLLGWEVYGQSVLERMSKIAFGKMVWSSFNWFVGY